LLQLHCHYEIPLFLYGNDFSTVDHQDSWDYSSKNQHIRGLKKPSIQLKSTAAALLAVHLLHDHLPVSEGVIRHSMEQIFVPGRLQLYSYADTGVDVLFDVSHNPQSAHLLAHTIQARFKGRAVHAVFAALRDKDLLGMIRPLKQCVDRWYFAQLDNPRASASEQVLELARKEQILVEMCYDSPVVAFEDALAHTRSQDLIVVFGSFYTVAQVVLSEHLDRCIGCNYSESVRKKGGM